MDCERFGRSLGAWLDNRIDSRTRASLTLHLLGCPDCRLLHDTRVKLRDLVRAANSEASLPHFVTSILERVPHAKVRR